jgi:preprotein translocase subunit YajC
MQKPPSVKVGDKFTNKSGDVVTIVEYVTSKKITIEYEDGVRVVARQGNLNRGAFKHPTKGKIFVGDKFPSVDGDIVEVLEYNSCTNVLVRWPDGEVSKTYADILKEGKLKHPTRGKIFVGDVFKTNNGHTVTVKEYIDAWNVRVVFEDGEETTVQASNLRKGVVGHPKSTLQVGERFVTKSGWPYTVVEYRNAWDVTVEFEDGSRQTASAHAARNGAIKPQNQPSVEGIGYLGIGRFTSGLRESGEKADECIYGFWIRMFSRCYNPYELNKPRNARYRDIHIAKEWHNFQNFAEWAYQQPYAFADDAELDKDLLSNGVKMYSPETCTIVPQEINLFLLEQDRGEYYRGVNVIKPKCPNAKVGYVARTCTDKGREYLGYYNTPEEAFYAYKARKEQYAKDLAEKWRDKIDPPAYEALMNYTVEITD